MGELSSVKITRFSVKNYKNLEKCDLKFENLAVIVGPNNSGKSNFLECFDVLRMLHYGGEESKSKVRALLWSASKPLQIKIDAKVNIDNHLHIVNYFIELKFIQKKDEKHLEITDESFFSKRKGRPGASSKIFSRTGTTLLAKSNKGTEKDYGIVKDEPAYSVLKSILAKKDSYNDDYIAFFEFIEIFHAKKFSPHKFDIDRNVKQNPYGSVLYNLQKENDIRFLKFKESFIDILNFKDFNVHKYSPNHDSSYIDYICYVNEHSSSEPVSFLEDLSDGTLIIFNLLYKIFITRDPICLIEEPEVGVHPSALVKLLNLFLDYEVDSQVILTTHSPYVLNLVNPKNIFLLEKNHNGRSCLQTILSIPELEKRLKSKYVDFGDLFIDNFRKSFDTTDVP